MSEDSEVYKMIKESVRRTKNSHLDNADKNLKKIGLKPEIDYVWTSDYMIKITLKEKQWTFWPSKMKWKRHFWDKEIKVGIGYLLNDLRLAMRQQGENK